MGEREPLPWGEQKTVRTPDEPCASFAIDEFPTEDAARDAFREMFRWTESQDRSVLIIGRVWLRVLPIDEDDEDEVAAAEEFPCLGFVYPCSATETGAREFWHVVLDEDGEQEAGAACWRCGTVPMEGEQLRLDGAEEG